MASAAHPSWLAPGWKVVFVTRVTKTTRVMPIDPRDGAGCKTGESCWLELKPGEVIIQVENPSGDYAGEFFSTGLPGTAATVRIATLSDTTGGGGAFASGVSVQSASGELRVATVRREDVPVPPSPKPKPPAPKPKSQIGIPIALGIAAAVAVKYYAPTASLFVPAAAGLAMGLASHTLIGHRAEIA